MSIDTDTFEQLWSQAAKKIMEQCEILGAISQSDVVDRRYLSSQHKQANQQVAAWMQAVGMITWQDSAGNQWGRYESEDPNAKSIILGSHLDTVPNGGKYDGMLGVLAPIALVDVYHQHQRSFAFHIDIVGFADEEGARFGATLLGSKALTGEWTQSMAALRDENGITLAQAMLNYGLDFDKVSLSKLDPSSILAFLELHIEQGPVLEQQEQALGVVTAIAGARRFLFDVKGFAGHAGTVPMNIRQDALAGVSEMILAAERIAKEHGVLATVGKIDNFPNGVNVIPGNTRFTLDLRSAYDNRRDSAFENILKSFNHIASQRKLAIQCTETHSAKAVHCNQALQSQLVTACTENGQKGMQLMSGAGHDTMAMANICKAAMLFLRCEKGISHHPAEAIEVNDVEQALIVLDYFIEHFQM